MIIPDENERDLKEIPDNVKQDLEIRPVKWMDQVLDIALERMPEPVDPSTDGREEVVVQDSGAEPGSVKDSDTLQIKTH